MARYIYLTRTSPQNTAYITNWAYSPVAAISEGYWNHIGFIENLSKKNADLSINLENDKDGLKFNFDSRPNPFNSSTTIQFTIPTTEKVTIKIFNIHGKLISNFDLGIKDAGKYEFNWNAENLPSGTYFCTIIAGQNNSAKN